MDLSALASCLDLTVEHAKQAAGSSAEIRALLKRVAQIARPGEGCPKVLMAIARLVGQDWIEGELRVELSGDEASTTVIVMCEYGVGICERLFPMVRFEVPLDEFERALELAPHLVLPLKITDEAGKLILTPLLTPEKRGDMAPPELELDEASLGEEERTTAPPPPDELQVVDEAMPEGPSYANPSGEHELAPHLDSGPVPSADNPDFHADGDRSSNVHTRPTVRRMVAVDVAAIAAVNRRDPRREED